MHAQLLPNDAAAEPPSESRAMGYLKSGVRYGLITFVAGFILAWALQGVLYFFATTAFGCNAGSLKNYNYVNNAAQKSKNHSDSYNIFPQTSFLLEKEPSLFDERFALVPVSVADNSSAGQDPTGASVGNWWLAWGPVFNTYVYENGLDTQNLVWMRRNMLRLGQSHRVGRCDGTGSVIEFEEGMNWFSNSFRRLFGMLQAFDMKIFVNGNDVVGRKLVGRVVESTSSEGAPSVKIMVWENLIETTVAHATLHNPKDAARGVHAQWYVENTFDIDLPYYVISAITLLYAFHYKNEAPKAAATELARRYIHNSTVVIESSRLL